MGHGLEKANGIIEAAYSVKPAWHKLGRVYDKPLTIDDLRKPGVIFNADPVTGKPWEPFKAPLFAKMPDGSFAEVKSHCATYRSDFANEDGGILGVVGSDYGLIGTADIIDIAASINADAPVETGFVLWGGRQVVLLLKIAEHAIGSDRIANYMLLSTAHDGSGRFRFLPTNLRVECANMFAMAIRAGHPMEISLRHSSNALDRAKQAAHVFKVILEMGVKDAEQARKMLDRKMSEMDFISYVDKVLPLPDEKTATGRKSNAHERIKMLRDFAIEDFYTGKAFDSSLVNAQNKGTLWAAFNSITGTIDHGPDDGVFLKAKNPSPEAIVDSMMFGAGADIKAKAYDAALQLIA